MTDYSSEFHLPHVSGNKVLKAYNQYRCAYFNMAPLKTIRSDADLDFMEEFFHCANVYVWLR